jgi:hypothetical protein
MWESQNGKCYYSGLKLSQEQGNKLIATIDRKDSSGTYNIDNVVICSYVSNVMKGQLSIKEFSYMITEIYANINSWSDEEAIG